MAHVYVKSNKLKNDNNILSQKLKESRKKYDSEKIQNDQMHSDVQKILGIVNYGQNQKFKDINRDFLCVLDQVFEAYNEMGT